LAGTQVNGRNEIPVIDYEGSQYQTDFWDGRGRDYEDATERMALKRLLPPRGPRIAEIGAGFGRLANLYLGYEQVVLFDYSRTLLRDAAQRWGQDPRFVFVAGNIYQLPLASGVCDTLVMVRVMHHLAAVDVALAELQRSLHSHGVAVLEYANKRNLKALLRWMTKQQNWSPVDQEPVEFVELNFDFHPSWMETQLGSAGFDVKRRYGVSHFRMPVLKSALSADKLARADSLLFNLGGRYPLAPSVFVKAEVVGMRQRVDVGFGLDDVAFLFRCPNCKTDGLERFDENVVSCPECNRHYGRRQGVWDFKEAMS
jgi:SAM-dependent methyltransferase